MSYKKSPNGRANHLGGRCRTAFCVLVSLNFSLISEPSAGRLQGVIAFLLLSVALTDSAGVSQYAFGHAYGELWKALISPCGPSSETRERLRPLFRHAESNGHWRPEANDILRRLEKAGEVFRDIGFHKQRPVNTYLAIDADSSGFRARIVDDHGWLFVIFEWLDESGSPLRSMSTTLGEFADYVRFQRDGQGVLDWPPCVQRLAETGRVSHDKFSWGVSRPPCNGT